MQFWSTVLAAAALIVIAVIAAFFIVGPERIWRFVGPADLGPVVFETLQRRRSPNDALACPPSICSGKIDMVPPVFAASASDLIAALDKVVSSEPDVEKVASDEAGQTRRYIQRTKILRFPDTIVIRILDLGDGRSTLALYSRSQLGESDFGVNLARIRRWLDKLSKQAPVVRTA